jgi:hypothetical protein
VAIFAIEHLIALGFVTVETAKGGGGFGSMTPKELHMDINCDTST